MRVLWFVNIPFPFVSEYLGLEKGIRGGWLPSLAQEVVRHGEIELGIAYACKRVGDIERLQKDGVSYYLVRSLKSYRCSNPNAYGKEIARCQRVVENFDPDVVDVHGTENFYGLIGNRCEKPVIITVQGIVNEIKKHFFAGLGLKVLVRYPSILKEYLLFCRRCPVEIEIFKRNRVFSGRSLWDKSYVKSFVPYGDYFSVQRTLRPSFYKAKWELARAKKHVVYSTASVRTYKGAHLLLRAVRIVKDTFPGVKLRIAGRIGKSGFGRYLHKLIAKLDLEGNTFLLGPLDEGSVVRELLSCHVFAIPSFIENSPNSLAEALVVGTPAVSSFTGGIPSMVQDGETGLLFPRGDCHVMAHRIIEIFRDNACAESISKNSRKVARERHAPQSVYLSLLNMYTRVCNNE